MADQSSPSQRGQLPLQRQTTTLFPRARGFKNASIGELCDVVPVSIATNYISTMAHILHHRTLRIPPKVVGRWATSALQLALSPLATLPIAALEHGRSETMSTLKRSDQRDERKIEKIFTHSATLGALLRYKILKIDKKKSRHPDKAACLSFPLPSASYIAGTPNH